MKEILEKYYKCTIIESCEEEGLFYRREDNNEVVGIFVTFEADF